MIWKLDTLFTRNPKLEMFVSKLEKNNIPFGQFIVINLSSVCVIYYHQVISAAIRLKMTIVIRLDSTKVTCAVWIGNQEIRTYHRDSQTENAVSAEE